MQNVFFNFLNFFSLRFDYRTYANNQRKEEMHFIQNLKSFHKQMIDNL